MLQRRQTLATLCASACLGVVALSSATAAPAPAAPATAAPAAPTAKSSEDVDVDALRQEYLKLRDELFASRARAAAVASQLYTSKISIRLNFTSGRFYGVTRAIVRLDHASVYDNSTGAIATDDGVRFEGYVAPGRHQLTFRVEAQGKDDEHFQTTTESSVIVEAVAGKDLVIAARAADDGDIAYQWKRDEHGSYNLGLHVDVKTLAHAAAAPAKTSALPTTTRIARD